MKKIILILTIPLLFLYCAGEPEKPKPNFTFTMSSNLKDRSFINFKATIYTDNEERRDYLNKRVDRIKQALRLKFKVLIARQVKDEKKVAKLIKIILEGRKSKGIDVVVTDFNLKK